MNVSADPLRFTTPRSLGVDAVTWIGAIVLHAGLFFFSSAPSPAPPERWASLVDVTIEEPPPAEEPPAPEPEEEPPAPPEPPESVPEPRIEPRPVASAPPSPAPEESPPPETAPGSGSPDPGEPAELATASSSSWSAPSGTGTRLDGGRAGRRVGTSSAAPRATSIAPRDLSREAMAPYLKPYVDRNFPSTARMYKVNGEALVSVNIGTGGETSEVRVEDVSPSGRGFGEACARSILQGPKWKPKLNRDGRPVATRVSYRCRFVLPESTSSAPGTPPTSGTGANRIWTQAP